MDVTSLVPDARATRVGEVNLAPAVRTRMEVIDAWVRLLRPRQWVKNTFVLAPLVFSGRVAVFASVGEALAAFVLFCMLASGIYCWNDVADRDADRAHPGKRLRPVAAGMIAPHSALGFGLTLVAAALTLGYAVAPALSFMLLLYVLLNILYLAKLKEVVILDVFAIAAFFILRLLAGCVAISVEPSVWLLLCGGLLSLFLGFAKRRHELLLMGDSSTSHRSVLQFYDASLLDQMSVILLSVTVVSYIMYTLNSRTASIVGSETLSYSTVFVLYGAFRYLYLVHRRRDPGGGDPAETLLTDRSLMVTVSLWLLYCGWAIYLR